MERRVQTHNTTLFTNSSDKKPPWSAAKPFIPVTESNAPDSTCYSKINVLSYCWTKSVIYAQLFKRTSSVNSHWNTDKREKDWNLTWERTENTSLPVPRDSLDCAAWAVRERKTTPPRRLSARETEDQTRQSFHDLFLCNFKATSICQTSVNGHSPDLWLQLVSKEQALHQKFIGGAADSCVCTGTKWKRDHLAWRFQRQFPPAVRSAKQNCNKQYSHYCIRASHYPCSFGHITRFEAL